MKTTDFIKENQQLADDATAMHRDHEVQMAREECYHIATNAIELHKLLKTVAEADGIDGWASEKISIANDYVRTVREWLEYELMTNQGNQLGEDASAGATGAASIGASAVPLLFGKKKIIKRKKS